MSEIFKTMGTPMPAWKKVMNKIAHVFLHSCFQVLKERYVFKAKSRIRLATIYIYPIHSYICRSWFDCMTQLSLDLRFDITTYVLQVCSFMFSPFLWAPL
jgi:hypothetical protein